MAINLDFLKRAYFAFDKPVPYQFKDGSVVDIVPVSLMDSELFLPCINILTIDKNSIPDPKIISMTYLQFMVEKLLEDKINVQKFVNILKLCLGLNYPTINQDDRGKPYLYDIERHTTIDAKAFDDIKRIILYQNIINYDDAYVNPDLKKSMELQDEVKNKQYDMPDVERRMAIITAHCGLVKSEQLKMTYRSHMALFNEICGEVEFETVRPVALFGGNGDKVEHWIYPKKKGKFDKYLTDVDRYTKSMGGDKAMRTSDTQAGDKYMEQFNNFKK